MDVVICMEQEKKYSLIGVWYLPKGTVSLHLNAVPVGLDFLGSRLSHRVLHIAVSVGNWCSRPWPGIYQQAFVCVRVRAYSI